MAETNSYVLDKKLPHQFSLNTLERMQESHKRRDG